MQIGDQAPKPHLTSWDTSIDVIFKFRFTFATDLSHIRNREIAALSGGELQRFAIAMVCIQNGDIFMFDEPSSYLDVKQRLNAARTIRSLIHPDKYDSFVSVRCLCLKQATGQLNATIVSDHAKPEYLNTSMFQ